MKIAFIGQKGIPAIFGGIEQHVDDLARRLAAKGHTIHVYVRSWYTPQQQFQYEGTHLHHTPTIKGKHLDAFIHSFTSSVDALFRNYDIVHYHALGPSVFAWIPKISRKRVVCTIHRLDWQSGKWGKFARSFLKFGESTASRLPARTIVVSKTLKKYFEESFDREFIYIPNGVDLPDKQKPDLIRSEYGLAGDDYILFMGRLVPEKRPDWLIRGFQEISENNPDLKLVIAGGESGAHGYFDELRAMAGSSSRIIFTGYVTGFLKEELFSNARLFVLPSFLEGLPIALLEAMSYGLSCLASDIDPHQEVLEDGFDGFLFKQDDFSDFVSRLRRLTGNGPASQTIRANARTKVAESYNWELVTQETEKVYAGVMSGSPADEDHLK